MDSIASRLAALPQEKRELLLRQFHQRKNSVQGQIEPQKRDTHLLPLSFAQQRLWFLDQLEPGNISYNMSGAVRMRGTLYIRALEQSMQAVVARHETLRTTFVMVQDQPWQNITPSLMLPLPVVDLRLLSDPIREEMALHTARAESQKAFDLACGPLLRVTLLQLGEDDYVLCVTMHHIVSDGWSLSIFLRELCSFYASIVENAPITLNDLPIQYSDFAIWQRQLLQGEILEKHEMYWRKQLAALPDTLDLPTDHPRPTLPSYRGARRPIRVPKPMLDELKMLGQREGATLFMTLLAALQVLLYRYTYQEDIVVGTPIANRTRKEIEGLIGFFVNTLVLRTNLSGKPIFYELLRRVRDMTLDAYTHQDLPFEYLVDMLQPERDMSRSVLFQVMFSMQNTPPIKAEFAHLELQEMGIEDTTAKFDLTLLIQDTEQDLLGSWVYSTDLFDESTIDRLNEHFQSLLEAIIQHPDRPITAYTLISQQERDKLLFAFNGPQPRFSTQTLVHERFEAQALHTPDTVALVFEDQHMTYAELDRRANQLAHYLQGLGVGPQVPVGLCMERSLTLIIGLLGILKAGGAYVPLDPTYPQQRLAFLLQDAQMPVVLTQQHLNERLSLQQDKVDVVCLDTEWSLIETMAVEKPQGAVSESLMYIIYTSGSTGVPKGVQVSHANVVRLFAATEEEFDFDSHDCWTLFHSYAFDFSVWELWGALLYGGRLVVVPYNISRSSSDLYQLLYEQGVTVLNQTPSAFWHFLQIEERHTRPEALALRLVIFGGEALSPQRLRSWSERHGLACPRMVNMYGITETTVHVTAHTLVDADVTGSGGSVAGSALADLQVYILDEQQQPVPIGITGEIYVGGAGLAWGYLNWPDLTAERFVPHPWSQEPGARLYKSGDLARYRADGVLEYLGRRDQQVKVRGHRIELGEIEAHLHEHPSIADCVVQIGEGYQGEKLLIAYVVIQKQEVFRADELRVYLRAKLPDYMVPAIYVQLETLPLTSNGKVDRRALPVPQPQSADVPSRDTGYPGTPLEEMVGNVWAQVLKLDQVHPGDDFFALGGHSLFATQVISRLNTLLGVDIPLRSIFEHSTVTALARHIEHLLLRKQGMDIPPLVSISREQELPLSFAQQRLWFLDQFVPDNPFYNISVAIRLEGKLQLQALEQSLNEITQRHEALRTTFINENGTPRQIITPKVSIPLPVVDLVWLSGEERDVICKVLLHQESQRPFDLVHGPLLRAGILRLEPGKQILQLTMHHIVSDGWSMGVFVRELMACYAHFAFGASLSLPELTIQYADFAIWQREWLQGEVLEQHLSYWKQQLEQAPALLEIPTDRPRPAVQSYRGGHYSFLLPLSLRENLKELSQREGVTFFMTLLAVFKTLLYRYTEQEDIVVGTPIANRRQTQIENLIGFFVNMLVLRTNLAGNPTFLELLGRVRETALDAYAHQDLPFEQLVDALHPEREMSHAPLFQVLFVLQNIPMLEATFENVTLSQMELDNDTSKYDLALFMGECKDGLLGTIEYSTDLFDTETIARMVLHFKTLLEAVLANPLQRVMDLPLLTSAEKQQVLLDWNATQSDYLRDTGLQHLFEKQAKRTPDVVAIAFEDQQITYAELDHLANQLATALQGLGVGQESLVGLCMERSIELLIGMLGILKAGGAYVPLDPTYPQARLAFMLQDSKATVLVTQHHLIQDLPTQNLRLLCVSAETFAHDVEPNLPVMFSSEQAAYVIYTSGSTGKPKGTVISHRAVINFFASMCREPGIRSSDRILAVTSLSFDIAALELLLPLTIGACINLASRQVTTDGAALAKLLGTSGATLLQATPSTWRMLIGSGWAGSPHLKMLCGGEALPEELAAQLLSCGEELWNMYGPTETTIWSAICQIAREHEPITIGRPIDNTQLYVLDVTGTPVPIGVAGELYIGGDGIARGYWQRPELSADRFVPDPFCMRSGARMYRTGDKVRWLASGTLEYLGRMDQQVKLRGYRIELGEIEEVLRQVPYVKEGVVLVREDTPGEMRLIAYIVPNPEEQELEAGSDQWKDEHVEQWQLLWSETYRATGYLEDRTFNITGWNSSYTGLPIPAQEMREQVEQAVARILVRRPQKVLEIGCGTGLLLFRIAPFCAEYHASDFSSDALQYVQQVLSMRSLPQVRLALQSAQEALNVQEGTFDAVILNSVVQYFPDIHYLVQVLEGCIAALRPGGFLFIGDVRCLPLLRAYATSVELYQADSSLSRSELRRRVQQRVVEEEELLIDPAFFYALQQSLPHIGQVQVLLKRGDAENELTRFRYDIVVRKEATEEAGATQIVWQWGRESIDLSSIEQYLQRSGPEILHIRGVPNKRLAQEMKAVSWLFGEQGSETVGAFLEESETQDVQGLDPETLWVLGEKMGYTVKISWSMDGEVGNYDVVFEKGVDIQIRPCDVQSAMRPTISSRTWLKYANNPLQGKMMRTAIPRLRNFLKERLPEYMVPSLYMVLDRFPLTPNGKIDRRAFPAPQGIKAERDGIFVAPRDAVEEVLVGLWGELLGIKQIGIHDKFFDLGGHSLLATQLISRIRTALGVDLPLRQLFEGPTVAEIARQVHNARQQPARLLPPPQPVARDQELPLSFAQQRLWFLEQLEPGSPAYNMPLSVRMKGHLRLKILQQCIQTVIQRHESLRTSFQVRAGQPYQQIHPTQDVQQPLIDLSDLAQGRRELEARLLVQQEALQPLDLRAGVLLRVTVLRLQEQEHVLLLTLHHIVADGWSLGVLVREVSGIYSALAEGQVPTLPSLPIQYADYAFWQRNWLQGTELEEQLTYWEQKLKRAATLNFPTDYPRPALQSYRGRSCAFRISRSLTEAIKGLSRQQDTTLFMTLLAAFQTLLHQYTGQEDIVVGTDIANRTCVETEGLIGFFVNLLVLRTDFRGNPSFREVLTRVRETVLGAYAHQDVPFEMVVERLHLERVANRTPLVRVLFVLQNMPLPDEQHLPDLTLSPFGSEITTSKFDMAFFVSEEAQELRGTAVYSTDLFEPSTITNLLYQFEVLLQKITTQSDELIGNLELRDQPKGGAKKREQRDMRRQMLHRLKKSKESVSES